MLLNEWTLNHILEWLFVVYLNVIYGIIPFKRVIVLANSIRMGRDCIFIKSIKTSARAENCDGRVYWISAQITVWWPDIYSSQTNE